ncbi:MAG TPA: alpha-hydroxy acid oxidase [Steroidobacteraceae bacterium]|jgi:isopentenyl diphosphate isomerase/L-lactate dehydrogenase-like FMN-dependent dehydrogenase|nr:alpha-hydroxy acid oxidase [Steroidobacteraceae bacterium]
MNDTDLPSRARRFVLKGLAAAPALIGLPRLGLNLAVGEPAAGASVLSADKVFNIADFEALARAKLPPAHFGYISTGVDDDLTVFLNHEAYSHIEIRARRFVDVSKLDTRCRVLGSVWKQPFYFSAVSSMRAFHPEGEAAVARAAASRDIQVMLSTGSSCPVEEVIAERRAPVWQQLYATDDWQVTEAIVHRAEKAGCTAIVLTVDSFPGRNTETLLRAMQADGRDCTLCHVGGSHDMVRRAPMFAGIDVSRVTALSPSNMSGNYLERVRKLVSVKFLVKGIVEPDDATRAIHAGVDGIVVSNHGGRQEETLRSTIECLPEIVAAVAGRAPVFIDGGIRRGTDIFKALALGATAVGIGRPQVWGLAAFGQPGAEAISDIFTRELLSIMRQTGTPELAAIKKDRLA